MGSHSVFRIRRIMPRCVVLYFPFVSSRSIRTNRIVISRVIQNERSDAYYYVWRLPGSPDLPKCHYIILYRYFFSGDIMVELIYMLLHMDADCYHQRQNGCVKGYLSRI